MISVSYGPMVTLVPAAGMPPLFQCLRDQDERTVGIYHNILLARLPPHRGPPSIIVPPPPAATGVRLRSVGMRYGKVTWSVSAPARCRVVRPPLRSRHDPLGTQSRWAGHRPLHPRAGR